jgi:hypothetical protein
MPTLCPIQSSGKSNVLALCVSAASLCVIFGSFDPVPAGEDLVSSRSPSAVEDSVPLPDDARVMPSAALHASPIAESTSTSQSADQPAHGGILLNNSEALKFSLLLMQDGLSFMKNVDTYSAVFNKRERIQGDLGDVQTIELKVRHEPAFSVYMKWKTGDTGRQLLYNEEYEDKKMVVKLGGFKGRLLPAIKLQPTSPEAMSQARYPVTEAGVLGMLKLLVFHRQNDLNHGQGVICRRLPNAVCDERECYCFLYEYQSPEFNQTYRKSMLMLDSRYHIPLRLINHTWTESADGLTAAELDEQTLIEDYSFSRIDFGRELVVEDFSRNNPAYRM